MPKLITRVSLARTRLSAAWHDLLRSVSDPYRPERHYMRGPGPKWRAKYSSRQSV
jgi:hypothetical protein